MASMDPLVVEIRTGAEVRADELKKVADHIETTEMDREGIVAWLNKRAYETLNGRREVFGINVESRGGPGVLNCCKHDEPRRAHEFGLR
jgi:hypothetical protein